MTVIFFLIVGIVFAAKLTPAQGDCFSDIRDCGSKAVTNGSKEEMCKGVRNVVGCLKGINKDDCSYLTDMIEILIKPIDVKLNKQEQECSAILTPAQANCLIDITECQIKAATSGSTEELCKGGRNFVDCLKGVNKDDCSFLKDMTENLTKTLDELNRQEQECLAILTAQGGCHKGFTDCQSKAVTSGSKEEMCKGGRNVVQCLKGINKVDCSDLKDVIEIMVKTMDAELNKQECSGVSSLMSSLALTLGLSGLAYFLTSLK